MTRSKWLTSLVGLLLLAGGAFFFFRGAGPAPEAASAPSAAAALPAAPSAEAQQFRAGPPMKRVMDLYETESARVGQTDPDPKATRKRLEAVARELSGEEIAWLGGQALDPKTDADARFFAVYLMGLSSHASSIPVLARLALSPIPENKNERKMMEDRALRMSAVEGICTAENCKIPEAREQLLDLTQASDEAVRDRAHRCLYFCQYGKSIEEQDKDALRKARGGKGAR